MEWSSSITIKYENKVVEDAVNALKEAFKSVDYDEKYGYKQAISKKLCKLLDEMLENEEFEADTIELQEVMEEAYNPYDTVKIYKDVLTFMAKAMPEEAFECTIESSSTYDDSTVDAKYDGDILTYSYSYGEIGWNELECEECGYSEEIEEYNPEGIYECPECGEEIEKSETYEEDSFEIEI